MVWLSSDRAKKIPPAMPFTGKVNIALHPPERAINTLAQPNQQLAKASGEERSNSELLPPRLMSLRAIPQQNEDDQKDSFSSTAIRCLINGLVKYAALPHRSLQGGRPHLNISS